jgi:MFS family permease
VCLQIISILGLGSVTWINDKITFVLFSLFWKVLCGIGSGMNSTAAIAIIAAHYKHEREKTIGMMESSSGIGLLLGPFIGAVLYSLGGYLLPFFVTGTLSFFSDDFSCLVFVSISYDYLLFAQNC